MRSPTLPPIRMKAADTSASSAIADWTPLTVVPRSRTTAEIDTFINEVSTTSTNIAIANRSPSSRLPVASSGALVLPGSVIGRHGRRTPRSAHWTSAHPFPCERRAPGVGRPAGRPSHRDEARLGTHRCGHPGGMNPKREGMGPGRHTAHRRSPDCRRRRTDHQLGRGRSPPLGGDWRLGGRAEPAGGRPHRGRDAADRRGSYGRSHPREATPIRGAATSIPARPSD